GGARERDHDLGQREGVLLQALGEVGIEAWQGHVQLQEQRPHAARLQHQRPQDAADRTGQGSQTHRHVQEEGQLPLPLHRAGTRRRWNEGRLQGSLTTSRRPCLRPLPPAAGGISAPLTRPATRLPPADPIDGGPTPCAVRKRAAREPTTTAGWAGTIVRRTSKGALQMMSLTNRVQTRRQRTIALAIAVVVVAVVAVAAVAIASDDDSGG